MVNTKNEICEKDLWLYFAKNDHQKVLSTFLGEIIIFLMRICKNYLQNLKNKKMAPSLRNQNSAQNYFMHLATLLRAIEDSK